MVEFSATLSDALAPVTLISGVGLLLVSMSARYCHATSRIRQLLAERKEEFRRFPRRNRPVHRPDLASVPAHA